MQLGRSFAVISSYLILVASLIYFMMHEPWRYAEISTALDREKSSPAISEVVLDMKAIALAGSYTRFQLSKALQADALTVQRATEYLYPIRIVQENAPIFAENPHDVETMCRELIARKSVAVYDCG